jgi:nucleotide-binding universal stress UspA family protein
MSTNVPSSASAPIARQPLTVLVPLDGSPLAERALPVAKHVCRALNGKLVLARVLPTVVLPLAAYGGYLPGDIYQQLADDQRRMAEQDLNPLAERLRAEGLPVDARFQMGEPAPSLLDLAERLPADLIVMTTHGRTGLARFALGSVADRVVRGSDVPVLLLRSFAESAAAPEATPALQRGLVPLDGTPLAEHALDPARQLAGSLLQQLTLLRVADPRDGQPGLDQAQQYLDTVRSQLLGQLATGTCTVETLVRSGSAADVILAATAHQHDLIIMATHGSAGIGRWVVGTVTDRVLRGGQTPLLLVHPRHDSRGEER